MIFVAYAASCVLVFCLFLFLIWWRSADGDSIPEEDRALAGLVIFLCAAMWPVLLIVGGAWGIFWCIGWVVSKAFEGRKRW